MFYCVCKFPQKEEKFILFDKEEFNPIEFNLEKIQQIELKDLATEFRNLSLLSLNDFMLRIFQSKSRTITHILGELGIDTFEELDREYTLIVSKKSNLSKSQRDIVEKRYTELTNV